MIQEVVTQACAVIEGLETKAGSCQKQELALASRQLFCDDPELRPFSSLPP